MSKSSMVTNGRIRSMVVNKNYSDGWDRIFGKKNKDDNIHVQDGRDSDKKDGKSDTGST